MRRTLATAVIALLLLPAVALPAAAAQPGPAVVAAAQPSSVTIGFQPLTTMEPVVTLRGSAPRGKAVLVRVNGQVRDRVIAMATMDVYRYDLALAVGENRVEVELEEGGDRAAVTLWRVTATFDDLATHPLREDVEILATLGAVGGTAPGRFEPGATVTRAQLTKVLVLALGGETASSAPAPAPGPTAPAFADSDRIPAWAVPYIGQVVAAGWLGGYPDGTFRPDAPVTRLELAVIASRVLRSRGITRAPDGRPFLDQHDVPAWAEADVSLAMGAGIIHQDWLGRLLEPDRRANRAEMAAAVRRLWSVVPR